MSVACIACGGSALPTPVLRRGDGVELVRCSACGLLQVAHSPENPASLYGPEYFQKSADGQAGVGYIAYDAIPWTESLWQAALTRAAMGQRPLRVLDVGCATGRYLRYASAFGWDAVGIDISEEAAATARARGLTAFAGELMDMGFPDRHFDAVVCWDVLEHFTSFREFLAECGRVLKPDGMVFFSTPDCDSPQARRDGASWVGFHSSYEHTAYFERATIRRLLVRALGGHVCLSRRSRGPFAFLLGYWSPARDVGEEALPPPWADDMDSTILRLSFDPVGADAPAETGAEPFVRAWQSLTVADWPGAFRHLCACAPHPYVHLLWQALANGLQASAPLALRSEHDIRARLHQLELIAEAATDLGIRVGGQAGVDSVEEHELAAAVEAPEPAPSPVEDAPPVSAGEDAEGLRAELSLLSNALWASRQREDVERQAAARARSEHEAEVNEWRVRSQALAGELDRIHGSKSWKTLARFWALRRRLRRWAGRQQNTSLLAPSSVTLPTGPNAPPGTVHQAGPRPALGGGLYDVLIFGVINWGFRFQRPQQLARTLVRAGHRVLYVAAEFTSGQRPEVREVAPGITEVVLASSVPGLTPYGAPMDPQRMRDFYTQIAGLRAQRCLGSVVSVVDLPFWSPLAFALRQAFGWRVVYDCMDRHAGFSTNGPAMLALEDQLVRDADAVVVSSQALLEDVEKRRSAATELVRNAADVEYFSQAFSTGPAHLEKPVVVGYYGAIAEWFDTDAVVSLARRHPDWRVTLVGDVTNPAVRTQLANLSNVRLTGEVPYTSLLAHLRTFSACLIPFVVTPLTQATNPVKLYEYMASGRPCVSARLPEVEAVAREYPGSVELVDAGADWASAVERAIEQDSEDRRTMRARAARANDWTQRGAALRGVFRRVHPSVSIIVICYNNAEYTSECLQAIDSWAWSYPGVLEVIAVDNGSSDGTPDLLRSWAANRSGVTLHLHGENLGFAAANNRAVEAARGDIILFLNNDAYLTPGSVERLVTHLETPGVGLVGPVTNEIGNEARVAATYARLEDMVPFALQYTAAHAGQSFDIAVCALFCAVIERDVLLALGGLDERFEVGMFEDDDLAMAVRRQGLRVVCAEDVFVHHVGRAAFSQMPDARYQELLLSNRRRWEDKWGVPWVPHRYRAESEGEEGGALGAGA